MNALPKNYYFQNNIKHPKKDIAKERFNKTYNQTMIFSHNDYYGCIEGEPRCYSTKRSFENKDAIEITMDQFLEMTCSINDIIFPDKQTNMNKKLLGYKPKSTTEYDWYYGFPFVESQWEIQELIKKDGFWFKPNSAKFNTFQKAGVLDIWFDKVYEEEKKIFTLDREGGTFELEVSKEGVYYKPDNVWLDTNSLRNYINGRDFISNLKGSVKPKDGSNKQTYTVQYSHINLGCKKHIPILQLEEVIDYYELLNK